MFRLLTKSFPRHFRKSSWMQKRHLFSNQSKYQFLLNRLRDKKDDIDAQREVLGVVVRTIEDEHHLMEPALKEEATKLILDLQSELKVPCSILEDNYRLGLALLGYCKPLDTEYLRVLSIDGGGIRGIVVIELLRRLEEMTNRKFFDLFDFICGVSTGSILVCGMTAKPGRTLTEGKKIYKYVAKRVFEQSSRFDIFAATSRLMFTHAYYDVDLWNSLLKEYISDIRIIDTAKFKGTPKFCCVSTTLSEDAIDAHVFRNYALPSNIESIYHGSHTAALWEVVRCSSAAPTYFGDFILDNQVHQDGGILYNNPSSVAIHEAKLLWPNQKICLVSFGTGRSINKRKVDSQKLYSLNQVSKLFNGDVAQTSSWKMKFMRILDRATDTEQAHQIMSDLMPPGTYFRFNPYLTEMIPMTECDEQKLKQAEKDALMYFRRNEDKFEDLAEMLTKPRSNMSLFKDFINKGIIS